MLASDADRDAAADHLSSALAEGRLTTDEHDERIEAAYAARTLGELGELTADLPAATQGHVEGEAPAAGGETGLCLRCALLILCPPAGVAWLLATRRRCRAGSRPALREKAPLPGAIPRAAGRASPAAGMPRLGGSGAEDR